MVYFKGPSLAQDGIKGAFNVYSRSAEGRTYTLLLPTVDDRLKEKALSRKTAFIICKALF